MGKNLDEHKIAVIVYVKEENDYKVCEESLREISLPAGRELEIIPVAHAASRGEAYQTGMEKSDAKYKVYIDSSAWLLDGRLLDAALEIFSGHPEIGVLGLSGTEVVAPNAPFWISPKRLGKWSDKDGNMHDFGAFDELFREVQTLDFYFLMTQYDVPWRTDLFADDLFLCAAQAVEFRRKGYKACVLRQDELWIVYAKENASTALALNERFLDEYSKDLFPLVSVVIPTYCRPEYFKIALDSVLAQTYRNIDIFITDNSPDDRTEKMMQPYLAKYPQIQYEHHKEYTARDNTMATRRYNNPKAEYVNWLMDDDVFMPKKIAEMISCYLFNPGVTLVTSYRQCIDADGNLIPERIDTKPIAEKTTCFPGKYIGKQTLMYLTNAIGEPTTVLIPKKLMKNGDLGWTGNEGRYLLTDVPTWLNLLEQGNMIYIREPLSQFRQHPGQQQKEFPVRFRVMVSWALQIRYAWERKVFLETEREVRLAILNWTKVALNILLEYHEQQPELLPDDVKDLRVLEQTFAGMAAALSNGYVLDYGEELDDETHTAARQKIVCMKHNR